MTEILLDIVFSIMAGALGVTVILGCSWVIYMAITCPQFFIPAGCGGG